jgi:hypothetical protein
MKIVIVTGGEKPIKDNLKIRINLSLDELNVIKFKV